MTRGTTPTILIKTGTDLTEAVEIYVTFAQGDETIIEKDADAVTVTADGIEIAMTQADTLAFLPGIYSVELQVRAKFADGTAIASNVVRLSVAKILKDGEI